MKKLIPFFMLLAGAYGALAQGIVTFQNSASFLADPPDRRVYMPDMTTAITGPAPGTTVSPFYAQLLYQDRTGTWIAHPTVARFFTSSANAGWWNGGSRTLVGAGSPAPGVTEAVNLQVRVWDGGVGTATVPARSFDEARAQGHLWGTSAVFVYTENWDVPRPTDATFMKEFRSFSLVPEPSVIGLGLIGVGALFMLRRRK
jgi:hypothetical protein